MLKPQLKLSIGTCIVQDKIVYLHEFFFIIHVCTCTWYKTVYLMWCPLRKVKLLIIDLSLNLELGTARALNKPFAS